METTLAKVEALPLTLAACLGIAEALKEADEATKEEKIARINQIAQIILEDLEPAEA